MSEACECNSFSSGDLRSILFRAACPVHIKTVFEPIETHSVKTGRKRCGDCKLWMTRECPKEKNVNGRNYGPSVNDIVCELFR